MLRLWKRIPSLQRKLMFVVLASMLVFLVYLLSTNGYTPISDAAKRMDQEPQDRGRPLLGDKYFLLDPVDAIPTMKPRTTERLHGGQIKVNNPPQGFPNVRPTTPGVRVDHPAINNQRTQGPLVFGQPSDHTGKPALDPYRGPQNERQKAVVEAFMHAWTAYKTYAWGHDELRPVSKGWQEWFGIGLTIVDSLDTMYIMGLKDEFKLSRDWVARNMTLRKDIDAQLFEIVIRALGGLLSAYHLSGDRIFLTRAIELGDGLFPCFHGPTKVPCNRINLKSGRGSFIEISTAETGTIQLEFRDLARSSNITKFEKAIEDISLHLHNLPKLDGLVSCFINSQTGHFRPSSTVSVGASADSYYEYLLKQWLQTGKTKPWLKNDYLEAVEGTKKHLLRYSEPSRMAFVGALSSMTSKGFRAEMEHLACFLPGTLALGYIEGLDPSHLELARELTRTCYEMYKRMPTGLSPEVVGININPNGRDDLYVSYSTQFNLQRPETVESLFYMYRATKDKKYQEWGWEIFQAFEKHTRLKEGYASIDSVRRPENPGYRDKMETFYLAETLKYLYLLFSDDPNLLPLDKFVINTEAHPLPRYQS